MLYIGKKPEKPNVGKIIVAVSAAIAGVAALAIVAYKLYQKFVPACKKAGWDITHSEKPDAVHEWGYWDELISQFIPWAVEAKDE